MAVQPQTPYKEYTANGSTKSFALEFDCDNQDHLIVLVDDVEAIVGTWSLSSGAVVFGNAPATGKKITVQRNTPFRRDGDFQSYDNSFRPGPVNKGFDWIWLKLQELGVADWILSNRIDALQSYVSQQDGILQENIDSLKNYVDDKDDELRNYLLNAIQEQGVALDQLEEYYSYLMQQLAQVAIDRGWAASFIVSADGSTQQEINDFGGAKWRNKPLGYDIGSTVKLDNGDIVKSTVDGNTSDPNNNMATWDQPYNVYDFKTEQPLQWYFDKYGNWDDAIFEAQKNVIVKGFSPKLIFPCGTIDIYKPILGGESLGNALDNALPDFNIKNSDGSFNYSYPTQLYGTTQPPYANQGNAVNGTIIRFRGCASREDLTYMNFGIIHNAPTNPLEFANDTTTTEDGWGYSNCVVENMAITTLNADGTQFATIHGIFLFRQHWHLIRNVVLHAIYGAGILANWIFDSNIENVVYWECGRMSPNYNDYVNDGNFSIEYQTYAPLHLMCTNLNDTTNFVKVSRGHFEHNKYAVADIIVAGGAPIWIEMSHHESGQGLINDAKCVVATNFGVKYPCQDSESGFDYKNFTKPARSTVLNFSRITGYAPAYKDAMILGQYTSIQTEAWNIALDVTINAGNSTVTFSSSNSLFGNFSASGTDAEKWLDLQNVKFSGNLSLNYCGAISLSNVEISGDFSCSNMYESSMSTLTAVTANKFSGDLKLANATVTATGNSASSLQSSSGTITYTNISAISGAWA